MLPSISAQIIKLQVGSVRSLDSDAYSAKPWTTGFFKEAVDGPLWLSVPSADGTRAALPGDAQADLEFHGGPEKAVCVYPAEHYPFWRQELNLDPFHFGAFGENFTLAGLTEEQVCIGDIYSIGEGPDAPLLQVSQPRQPCWKLARRWNVKTLALQVQQTGKTGWYFRVLEERMVAPNQTLTLVSRPHSEWPLSLANQIMHIDKHDLQASAQLANCSALSVSWKKTLSERAQKR
ncbi:MOSC domain-containing protein [bacterium]|nr:MAG: MOSC domain-containing protein [bacterium]